MEEDWLHEAAQCGVSEFINNDNPLSCCKILEETLIRVLQEAYQSWLSGSVLSVCARGLEGFKDYGGIFFRGHNACSEVSEKHKVQLNVHLMNRPCLDIYMALSSSYKVLAAGCYSPCSESSSACEDESIEERREIEWSLVSFVYTLVLAATVQYMYDYGEPGMLGVAAHSWLQTGEALVTLISKLDGYFNLDAPSETRELCRRPSGDGRESMVFLCGKESVYLLKRFLNAYGRPSEAASSSNSTLDFLRCAVTSLWPSLRNISPFLAHIETPFDICKVIFGASEKQSLIVESRDVWIHHRPEAFAGALGALQLGLELSNICYGFSEKRVGALRDFLSYHFCKLSAG